MKELKLYCEICGVELEKKSLQIDFRKYMSRPIYNYKSIERFDVCKKCFDKILDKLMGVNNEDNI